MVFPFQFHRLCLSFIFLIAVILNECGRTTVVARTWPRMKSYGKIYEKKSLFSANATTTSTAPTIISTSPLPRTGERNYSLSEINSRASLADYKLQNGSATRNWSSSRSRCNIDLHQEKTGLKQIAAGGDDDDGKWSNENNCIAGPFHFGKDVNETVYKKLCPLEDGIFAVPGTCNLYSECRNGTFTLNQCEHHQPNFDEGLGRCSEIKGNMLCSNDLGDEIKGLTLRDILHRIILFISRIATLARSSSGQVTAVDDIQTVEETRLVPAIQLLDENSDSSSITQSKSSKSSTPQNINTQLDNICRSPSSPNGLYSHPHLCSKYIQCGASSGTYFLQSCGPGTVFNPELSICDWPSNVPHCVLSRDGTYIIANGQRVANELALRRKRSPSPVSSIIANDNVHFPLSRKSLMTRKKRASSSSSKENCGDDDGEKENYIQPDPMHCNKYKVCSNGRFISVTSGQGTLFNPFKSVCDFADNVDCQSRHQDFGTYGCEAGDAYQAPHPEFCNKFVECEHGILAIKSCPPGTLYEREESRCDHASKITCRNPISLEHDVDINFRSGVERKTNSSHHHHLHHQHKRSLPIYWRPSRSSRDSAENDNKLNLACEYNYIAPHPRNCNRFVECENKRIFIKTCGPGTAYNPILGQCDWPHNIREPDTKDCTKYKVCKGSLYQTASCGYNQVFHPEQRKCVSGTPYQVDICRSGGTTTTTTEPDYPDYGPPPS